MGGSRCHWSGALGRAQTWPPLMLILCSSHSDDNGFSGTLLLPAGRYEYKYIVDDVWTHADDLPKTMASDGSLHNVVDVVSSLAASPGTLSRDFSEVSQDSDLFGAALGHAAGVMGACAAAAVARCAHDVSDDARASARARLAARLLWPGSA